jgi:hypothetical protein
MIVTKLLQFVGNSRNRWQIGAVIAVLATLIGSNTALADKPTRSIAPQESGEIYLYGESDRPNVLGKEYIIFETIGNKTIGAFYLPQSEFSCFYGRFNGSHLNLTLIDTYDRQKYNYTLTLAANGLTASKQPMMGSPTYQPLGKISALDRQILAACKTQLPQQ